MSSLFPKEKCGRNCKKSVDQRGKSLLPAVIDYGAWRKGDTYVFNPPIGCAADAARSEPQRLRMTLPATTRGVIAKRLVWPRRVWRITEVGSASKLGGAASHRISGSARAERTNIQGATAERSRRCNGIKCCRGLRTSGLRGKKSPHKKELTAFGQSRTLGLRNSAQFVQLSRQAILRLTRRVTQSCVQITHC